MFWFAVDYVTSDYVASDMLYCVMLNQALFWLLEASLSLSMRVWYFCLVVPFECHSRNPLMRQALPSDFSYILPVPNSVLTQ